MSCTKALQVTQLSKSSTGVLGRTSSYPPPLSCQLAPGGNSRPWVLTPAELQVKIQESLFIFFRCWTLQGGLYSKKGAGLSLGHTWWCLLFCPQDFCLQQSQLLEWVWGSNQPRVLDQLSHSISSSKVATVARAFHWASLALVRPLSAEVSLPPLLGVLLLRDWMSVGPGSSFLCDGSSPFCPRWSARETLSLQ